MKSVAVDFKLLAQIGTELLSLIEIKVMRVIEIKLVEVNEIQRLKSLAGDSQKKQDIIHMLLDSANKMWIPHEKSGFNSELWNSR